MGRPREFDLDEALQKAMEVFWRKGYEGTTLPDLTRAMGINRPSLYAAFGNKEALFRKAMDRYSAGPACRMLNALAAPTARAVAEQFLRAAAELQTDPDHPPGCLAVHGALAGGDAADPVRKELIARRIAVEAKFRSRFKRAIKEGDLPADASAGDLARYLATVVQGMAVQAAAGTSRAELQRVVDLALRSWPT
jgi:AcrR family transcriptional regulator